MEILQEKKNRFIEQQLWGFNDYNKELIEAMMARSANIINGDNSNLEKIEGMWQVLTILAEQIEK